MLTCPKHGPVFTGEKCSARGCRAKLNGVERGPVTRPVQGKLLGLDPGRSFVDVAVPEEDVEAAVRQGCAQAGVELLITTVRFRRQICTECGRTHRHNPAPYRKKDGSLSKGYGASEGIPDTIQIPSWMPPYLGALIELKGTETTLSKRQRQFRAERKIAVVRGRGSRDAAWAEDQRILEYLRILLEPAREKHFREGRWPTLEELLDHGRRE